MMQASVLLQLGILVAAGDGSFHASLSASDKYSKYAPTYPISIRVERRKGTAKVVDTHLRARSGEKTVELPHVRRYLPWVRLLIWSSLLFLPGEQWSIELFLEMEDGALVQVELELDPEVKANSFRGAGPLTEREMALLVSWTRKGADRGNDYRLGLLSGMRPDVLMGRKIHWEVQKGNLREALVCLAAVEAKGGIGCSAYERQVEYVVFAASPKEALSLIPRVTELAEQIAPEAEIDLGARAREFILRLYADPAKHLEHLSIGPAPLYWHGDDLAHWASAPDYLHTSDGRLAREVAVEVLERETGTRTPPGLTPQEARAFWEKEISDTYEFFEPRVNPALRPRGSGSPPSRGDSSLRGMWPGFALGIGAGIALAVLCFLAARLVRSAPARRK